MTTPTLDLWSLVRGRPQIDPNDLADAIVHQAAEEPLDYRTRLLIRDSVNALRAYWGANRVERWLTKNAGSNKIRVVCEDEFEKVGFPAIEKRIMEKTDPDTIEQYFREISRRVQRKMRLPVGGSAALISPGLLVCHTDGIDVVDEAPQELRPRRQLLEELKQRYGMMLAHFQQHYLPTGWHNRLHFHAAYGELEVHYVDPIDIFLGKLTSIRTKDLDDLRILAPQLDKSTIVQRLKIRCSLHSLLKR